MAETEKFSKSQIATLKHILKKGFAGYRRVDGRAACPELEELVEAGYLSKSYMEIRQGRKPGEVACGVRLSVS